MSKAIFWFRRDLRLKDNTALNQALKENSQVIAVYIIDPVFVNSQDTGSAKIKFIFDSLKDISERLSQYKSKLIIRFGKSDEQLIKLAQELDVRKIYFNRIYDIDSEYIDEKIKPLLENFSLEVFSCKDDILFTRSEVDEKEFEQYSKKWKLKFKKYKNGIINNSDYQKLVSKEENILSLAVPSLEDYNIEFQPNFPAGSETQANKVLNNLLLSKNYYLDYFDLISPYFEIGNLSIRQIIKYVDDNPSLNKSFIEKLIKYNYYSFYSLEYNTNKDVADYNKFLTWCRSQTGNPIVDACINQINNEYMVNSKIFSYVLDYLINCLHIDLKWIERYLTHKLVNISSTFLKYLLSEYSEKINPQYLKSENGVNEVSYDENYLNRYIKNYIPALKNIPDNYLLSPDSMPASLQKKVKCILGEDYPYPIYNSRYYQEINLELEL